MKISSEILQKAPKPRRKRLKRRRKWLDRCYYGRRPCCSDKRGCAG
jgi:hypothetical protein